MREGTERHKKMEGWLPFIHPSVHPVLYRFTLIDERQGSESKHMVPCRRGVMKSSKTRNRGRVMYHFVLTPCLLLVQEVTLCFPLLSFLPLSLLSPCDQKEMKAQRRRMNHKPDVGKPEGGSEARRGGKSGGRRERQRKRESSRI